MDRDPQKPYPIPWHVPIWPICGNTLPGIIVFYYVHLIIPELPD